MKDLIGVTLTRADTKFSINQKCEFKMEKSNDEEIQEVVDALWNDESTKAKTKKQKLNTKDDDLLNEVVDGLLQ